MNRVTKLFKKSHGFSGIDNMASEACENEGNIYLFIIGTAEKETILYMH